jgi:hypothetical protein
LNTQKTPTIANFNAGIQFSGVITQFKDYMEKLQCGIAGQIGPGLGDSRSQVLATLGLMQLFGQIIDTMQHRVIADLEAEISNLNGMNFSLNERVTSMGDPGLAYSLGKKGWRNLLDDPHDVIRDTLLACGSDGGEWTMANTWDTIWQMLPKDTDGIVARTQENIYCEGIKPCEIPLLEIYLPRLIIFCAVIPIVWDVDHRTLDFLGDDDIQQCLVNLHKFTMVDTDAKRAWKIPTLHSYSFKSSPC